MTTQSNVYLPTLVTRPSDNPRAYTQLKQVIGMFNKVKYIASTVFRTILNTHMTTLAPTSQFKQATKTRGIAKKQSHSIE